jgi:hypothetical protein
VPGSRVPRHFWSYPVSVDGVGLGIDWLIVSAQVGLIASCSSSVFPAASGGCAVVLRSWFMGSLEFRILRFSRLLRTIGFGAGLDDMRAIGDTIDQRLAQPGVGESPESIRIRANWWSG